jgi:hypothetical protein
VSSQDYRINAEVRRLLVSRWVDVSLLQIGTTNGVVYLMGSFEPAVEDALQRVGQPPEKDPAQRILRLLMQVDKDLRRLRGVRDVVLNLRNVRRKGGLWRVRGPQGEVYLEDPKKKKRRGGLQTVQCDPNRNVDEVGDDEAKDPAVGSS